MFVQLWGKNFVMVFVFQRIVGDIFCFVVSKDNIKVIVISKVNGIVVYYNFIIYYVGDYVQKKFSFFMYLYIQVSDLIVVFQFFQIQVLVYENIDFLMIIVFFIEQYGMDYMFIIFEYFKGQYQNQFMFIVDSCYKGGFFFDGYYLFYN